MGFSLYTFHTFVKVQSKDPFKIKKKIRTSKFAIPFSILYYGKKKTLSSNH